MTARPWNATEAERLRGFSDPTERRCACAECRCTTLTTTRVCGFCRRGMHEEEEPS